MSSFKSNENIGKKEDGSYYVISANKASSYLYNLVWSVRSDNKTDGSEVYVGLSDLTKKLMEVRYLLVCQIWQQNWWKWGICWSVRSDNKTDGSEVYVGLSDLTTKLMEVRYMLVCQIWQQNWWKWGICWSVRSDNKTDGSEVYVLYIKTSASAQNREKWLLGTFYSQTGPYVEPCSKQVGHKFYALDICGLMQIEISCTHTNDCISFHFEFKFFNNYVIPQLCIYSNMKYLLSTGVLLSY